MIDEVKPVVTGNDTEPAGTVDTGNQDYLAAITQLKETTVPKEKYEALEQERKRLLEAVVNGQTVTLEPVDQGLSDEELSELRKNLLNEDGELTNLEFAKNMLKLRTEVMRRGGIDPFLPVDPNIQITEFEIDKANSVADYIQHCIDYADGNSDLFTQELMRNMKDANPRAKNPFQK